MHYVTLWVHPGTAVLDLLQVPFQYLHVFSALQKFLLFPVTNTYNHHHRRHHHNDTHSDNKKHNHNNDDIYMMMILINTSDFPCAISII